ncbi:MAG: VOC family protein [Acidobacteriota bacterium]
MLKKLTPVLIVEAIEPVLPFWAALGFSQGPSVALGGKLGFVILERDGIEIMYQSVASVRNDVPAVLSGSVPVGAATLYIEVDDLDEVARLVPAGADVIVARRQTFYGATEMFVRDPAGHVIAFSQHG